MVTGPEHLRPDVPADIGVTPGGTFGGITAYLELMRVCWAQVSVTHSGMHQLSKQPLAMLQSLPGLVVQKRDSFDSVAPAPYLRLC